MELFRQNPLSSSAMGADDISCLSLLIYSVLLILCEPKCVLEFASDFFFEQKKMSAQVPTWFYAILVTVLYFGYIFVGGLVFMILERPDEIKTCEEITKLAQTARYNSDF